MDQRCAAVLAHFPPLVYACAYGSAALPQRGHDASKSLVDFLLVVGDTEAWHRQNLSPSYNPSHYSAGRHSSPLPRLLQRLGAGIYYNTDAVVAGVRLKYGVLSVATLLSDLTNWDTLYLAGRLHKPVLDLVSPPAALLAAKAANHQHAANVALLMLPSRFTLSDFLTRLVAISFTGDFRMGWAEDRSKVQNIVAGQYDRLSQIYLPLLHAAARPVGDEFVQDVDAPSRLNMLLGLPLNLQRTLWQRPLAPDPYLFLTRYHQGDPARLGAALSRGIAAIVRGPAVVQAAKGIATAGPAKALLYSIAKLRRSFQSALR